MAERETSQSPEWSRQQPERDRVLITDSLAPEGVERLEQAGLKVRWLPRQERARLGEHAAEVDALVIRTVTQVTAELLDAAPRVRVVGRAGAGLDNVDAAAAAARGVTVVSAPEANAVAAAEHTFALLLALARSVPLGDGELKGGEWRPDHPLGFELEGKTLGIVGFGRIGQRVARRARAFGMDVRVVDPVIDEEVLVEVDARVCADLDELLPAVDVLTLHVPLDDVTRGMIAGRELALLPPDSVLINCARGGVVVEDALLEHLDAGRLRGAGLDVFEHEPPLDPRLAAHPRVVATPHWGAHTTEAKRRVALEIAGNVIAALGSSRSRRSAGTG